MKLSEAEAIITEAIENNEKEINLSSLNHSEKLSDFDISILLPEILKLKNLKELNLSYNRLTVFNKEFSNLKKLEILNLSGNQLTIFDKEFSNLKSLEVLDLSDNQLTIFDKEFSNLKNLRILKLNDNQLTTFDEKFVELQNLQILQLENNQFTRFNKELGKLQNLQQLVLFNNPLPFPEEIINDFDNPQKILSFITDYYEAQEKGKLKPLNEAKLVVVGEANVGKTSIINRLLYNKFIHTNSTHGIEINHWRNVELDDKEKVQLNVWDFGGQEIMHSTHQFFFTKRTVYILVINARENEDTNKTEEWLQRIQNLSQNSPVFIVGNKIDENNRGTDSTSLGYFDIERKRLLEKFPNLIKGFYGVSSDVRETQFDFLFEDFRKALTSEIGKLREIHKEFPANWFDIKAQLEEMQAKKVPYITFRDYLKRCIKADIENEESQRTLIDFMHDLGIALSFQDDKELRDLAVLNPEWVTRGVYALIDNAQIALEKGTLRREDIGKYLNEKEYPKDTQDFIIKMMRKFRLLVDLEKDETFLIPDLLPKDEPDTGNWDNALHFQYNYEIYEKSILRNFIVEMYHLRSKETYWRNGIIMQYGENKALVKADSFMKTIIIKIEGNLNTRREFLAVIRREFDKIHEKFDGLQVTEFIGYQNGLIRYSDLVDLEENGIDEHYFPHIKARINVKELLNGITTNRNKEDNKISQRKPISLEDTLSKLESLRKQNILDEEIYEKVKNAIIESLAVTEMEKELKKVLSN